MGKIEDYFLKKTDQLAYLEIKRPLRISEVLTISGIPLPIRAFSFLSEMTTDRFEEEIDFQYFVQGMIWNWGIAPRFLYCEKYKEILEQTVKDPASYAIQMGWDHLKEKDDVKWERALISFRAAYLLDPANTFASIQYAQWLWKVIANHENQEDLRKEAVKESSQILEKVLSYDEYHSLANRALGELNEAIGQYTKATLYYQRALVKCEQEEMIDWIREDLDRISADTGVESAIYFLNRADYQNAISCLNEVKSQSSRYDVDYYLGLAFQNTMQYERACECYENALQKGADFGELFNNYVYALNECGEKEKALEMCNQALELHPADIRIRYNRAILLAEKRQYQKALQDTHFILEYDDLSDEMFQQVMILQTNIESMEETHEKS